ncbi:hypothetical protein B0A67_07155 [Flavobacterium aquidurense]|uniref:hypothetical protein n=1 Tax=Flavobacterium aquidurense TaxID=362413 RepID=UPI0009137750|nr:hypothetical protein [Flavobacterium aquidurense]OXA72629.1 hypothetical protein B0A67_07155 [Flavobacterium aquidurense]SHF96266.1 hypothetical protein SAMN05444481_101267 [Flavobacterium frigidimaris]
MEKHTLSVASLPLEDNAIPNSQIKKVDLLPDPESRLDSMEMKEKPLMNPGIPFRDLTSVASKKESIAHLIDKLDVENNLRYQRTVEDTYCNVYSYDYCYFSKAYLPTVWWTPESLEKVLQGQEVEVIFEQTVDRIYSSALHDWFLQWGASFGWKRMSTVDEMQNKVNANGGIGIICAKRREKGLSGHIVPVVPETALHKAYRENGIVVYPLQSQAGKLNYNYFAEVRKDWWNDELYSSCVLYYHE